MILGLCGNSYAFELELVVRIFYPREKIIVVDDIDFEHVYNYTGDILAAKKGRRLLVKLFGVISEKIIDREEDAEFHLGRMLFLLFTRQTGTNPAWGMLTGIRPVRLCGKWRASGLGDGDILKKLTEDYLVAEEKAALCLKVLDAQQDILSRNTPETFSLYVGIPFCPSRCLYCSYVSHSIDRAEKLVEDYLKRLDEELVLLGGVAKAKGMRLLTVYIGGGTPTVLGAEQLKALMWRIGASFDLNDIMEYTVEAGRADTVTPEKLAAIKTGGANRISINPQSMTPAVLNAINRPHSPEQVEQSFYLARQAGFGSVNMDIIAGLPEETPESFAESLDRVLRLRPENITVHALTNKRSSELRELDPGYLANPHAAQMQRKAAEKLDAAGYKPYYLYRQKPAADNLENTGYALRGYESAYNIYSMDDAHSILAAGAGAISKLVGEDGSIKRVFNHKYPYEYLSRFSEILDRKGGILKL